MEQKTAPISAEPSCGQCGYCVRGLDSLTCPECGSDLREVGIVTGRRRWLGRFLGTSIIWTLVVIVVALPISFLLLNYLLPVENEIHLQRVIFCMYPKLNVIITVRQEGRELVWNRHRPRVTVPTQMTLQANATNPMTVHLTTGGYDFTDPAGTTVHATTGFGRDALLRWFASAGVNTSDPLVIQGAADVLQCIDETQAAAGKFTKFSLRAGTQDIVAHPAFIVFRSYSPVWCVQGLNGLWVLIWVGGVWMNFRRCRRSVGG